jgi:hypothetical protein
MHAFFKKKCNVACNNLPQIKSSNLKMVQHYLQKVILHAFQVLFSTLCGKHVDVTEPNHHHMKGQTEGKRVGLTKQHPK